MADIAAVMALLQERLGGLLEGDGPITPLPNADIMVRVARGGLPAAARILKDELGFTTLMNHLGVDYGDRLAVIYNLFSPLHGAKATLKAVLDRAEAAAPTLVTVFPGAAWFERESYDLLGITFVGHGNLKRLLLPDDWEGHPLRKDYVFPTSYGGVDMRRADPLAPNAAPGDPHRG